MGTDPAAWAGESTKNSAMAAKPVPSINLFFITPASLGKQHARHKQPRIQIVLNYEEFYIVCTGSAARRPKSKAPAFARAFHGSG